MEKQIQLQQITNEDIKDSEENEQLQNYTMNTSSININKSVRHLDVDLDDESQTLTDVYIYHPHIFQLLIIGLLFFLLLEESFFPFYENKATIGPIMSTVLVVYPILCLIWCIIIVVVAFGMKNKSDEANKSILNYINKAIGIANTSNVGNDHNIFNIDRQYHGLIMLAVYINTSIVVLIWSTITDEFENMADARAQMGLEFTINTCFVTSVVMSAGGYFEISPKSQNEIQNIENKILEKYSHCDPVQRIVDKLTNKTLVDWRDKKLFKNRKGEVFIVFIMMCSMRVFDAVAEASGNKPVAVHIYFAYIIFMDIIFMSIVLLTCHTFLFHWKFAALIMHEFGLSINCKSIDDLFAWWELRKYFKYYVVKVYSAGFSGAIGACLFLVLILVFYTFYFIIVGEKLRAFISCIGMLLYVAGGTLLVVTHAVSYHQKQLAHSITINKEKLKLKKIHYMNTLDKNNNNTDQQMDIIQETIDIILNDVQNNTKTIQCFGIAMNYNFILFLRASAISIVVAFISIQ